jgi:hypothetical protein
MKTIFGIVALSATLILGPAVARAQEDQEAELDWQEAEPSQAWDAAPAYPQSAQPEHLVYPAEQVDASDRGGTSQGQWVDTEQYGWVWMPYGSGYTSLPSDGGAPSMYVYYPSFGWTWVIAPWIWGWGPMPYFGVAGWTHFGWFGHGFGRWDGFRGRYAGYHGRGYWNGGRWNGIRGAGPARYRGGQAAPAAAPWGGHGAMPRFGSGPSYRGLAGPRPFHSAIPRAAPTFAAREGFAGPGSARGSAGTRAWGQAGSGHVQGGRAGAWHR